MQSAQATAAEVTIRFTNISSGSELQVLEGFAACNGNPFQNNAIKLCPKVLPAPQLTSANCAGGPAKESPFKCDFVNSSFVLRPSDFYNSSRVSAPFKIEADGSVVVDISTCPAGTNGVTLNQVARVGGIGPCMRTLYSTASGLPATPFNVTAMLHR